MALTCTPGTSGTKEWTRKVITSSFEICLIWAPEYPFDFIFILRFASVRFLYVIIQLSQSGYYYLSPTFAIIKQL